MSTIQPPPTGAMPLDSPYYIERPSDREGLAVIQSQGVTISITGARQVGKTSLLVRLLAAAKSQGKQAVCLDFQGWEKETLGETDLFYRRFCAQLSARAELADRVGECWQKYGGAGASYCCSRYVQDYLLAQVVKRGATGLVIALDEVETLIDAPFRSEFFGLCRSWHNARALEASMRGLDLVLVISTEPYQLIEDLNQSPFNVGTELKLADFTPEEMAQLNAIYGEPLQGDELEALYQRVGGHPYLTAQVLAQVANNQVSRMQLWKAAHQEQGVFGSHLVYHRLRLEQRPELLAGMELIAQGKGKEVAKEVAVRLEMAGLVKMGGKSGVMPRCGIYQLYFQNLGANSSEVTVQSTDQPELPQNTSKRKAKPAPSPRRSVLLDGLFFMFLAVVAMVTVAVVAIRVPWYALVVVVLGGLLMIITVGVLQFFLGGYITEESFITLVGQVLGNLPVIRDTFPASNHKDAEEEAE